MSQSVTVRVDL